MVARPNKPVRMALCWKCGHAEINKQSSAVKCLKTGEVVTDFRNPPDGCPVKAMWANDDAAKAAGRKPVVEGAAATHVKTKAVKEEVPRKDLKKEDAKPTAKVKAGKFVCPKCGYDFSKHITPATVSYMCNRQKCNTWIEIRKSRLEGGNK